LLDEGVTNACFGPMIDPAAVLQQWGRSSCFVSKLICLFLFCFASNRTSCAMAPDCCDLPPMLPSPTSLCAPHLVFFCFCLHAASLLQAASLRSTPIGSEVTLALGGKCDPRFGGGPLTITGTLIVFQEDGKYTGSLLSHIFRILIPCDALARLS
jgi:hypothetical protein